MNTKRVLFILFVILVQTLAACGSPAAEPTSAPTLPPTAAPAPTATPELVDPAEVVTKFWESVNAFDFDTAMSFVADDIKCRGTVYMTGKDKFRVYLESAQKPGNNYVIRNLVVSGDTVTYDWQALRNDAVQAGGTGESMIIKDGKIIEFRGT